MVKKNRWEWAILAAVAVLLSLTLAACKPSGSSDPYIYHNPYYNPYGYHPSQPEFHRRPPPAPIAPRVQPPRIQPRPGR